MKPELKLKEKGYAVQKVDDRYYITLKDIWISFHYPMGIDYDTWKQKVLKSVQGIILYYDGKQTDKVLVYTKDARKVISISRTLFG